MLDRHLRQLKEDILQPITHWVRADLGLSPTQITLIGGGVGLLSAACAWQGAYALGLGLWVINRVLDGLDGAVARRFQLQSDIGGYIDIIVDDIIYAAIPIGMAVSVHQMTVYIALVMLLAVFYVNMASWSVLSSILEKRRRGAQQSGEMTTITMPGGLIEGTETILFYVLFFILPDYLALLFGAMALLTAITIGQRMVWALKHVR